MNKKIFFTIFMIVLVGILYYKTTYVDFYDAEFERYVREYMFVGENTSYMLFDKREAPIISFISQKDIERVESISLDLYDYHIKDLRDLKKFKNLESFYLAYLPGEEIRTRVDVPDNFEVISKLKKLKELDLCSVNVGKSDLYKDVETVKRLTITRCSVGELDFNGKFPQIEFLWLDDNTIFSMDFMEEMEELNTLLLTNNEYECSFKPLLLLPKLEELFIISNIPDLYAMLPVIPTIKSLRLGGATGPKKEEAEKYFHWESLVRLILNEATFEKLDGKWVELE